MFDSSEEYLAYLQDVLQQTDINEYLNVDELSKLQPLNKEDVGRIFNKCIDPNYEGLSSEKIVAFSNYLDDRYSLDLKSVKKDKRTKEGTFAIEAVVHNIFLKLPPAQKERFRNISTGGFFRLNASGLVFRSGENFAVLVSVGLLLLVWNNLSFLEATENPAGVLFTDVVDDASSIDSSSYINLHNAYLSTVEAYNLIEGVVFRFNDYSAEIIYQHFEIIVAFILFHELSHIINNDLFVDSNNRETELGADISAIEYLVSYYLPNHEYPLTKMDLIQMVEFYFFRLLHYCNIKSKTHPSPFDRTINLFSNMRSDGILSKEEFIQLKDYFVEVYGV